MKRRDNSGWNRLVNSTSGVTGSMSSNSTMQQIGAGVVISSFTSNGFSLGNDSDTNGSGAPHISWSFRKAPKFFDVVTYTGNGAANQYINHSLDGVPGFVIIKNIGSTSIWTVFAKKSTDEYACSTNGVGALNLTGQLGGIVSRSYFATSTTFDVASPWGLGTNTNGATYVAYLFAHDTSPTGMIQEGSFTTDASGNANISTIGWEPQYIMLKTTDTTGDWITLDQTRGWGVGADKVLFANTSGVETNATDYGAPTSNGFTAKGLSASLTYVYMVIRKAY